MTLLSTWTRAIGRALAEPKRAPAAFVEEMREGIAATRAQPTLAADEGAMPPLSAHLQATYGFTFTEDCYPVRPTATGELASPTFGAAVLRDYVDRYMDELDPHLLVAAEKVAEATFNRMEPVRDGLAFFYGGADGQKVARNPDRHYSAMTQSHYLIAFSRLIAALGDAPYGRAERARRVARWQEVTTATLRSLLVPAKDGGVLYPHAAGPILAGTPTFPHEAQLSAWLTVAQNLSTYARTGDETAASLFTETVRALEATVPAFDAPAFSTSRPVSTGFGTFRLEFPTGGDGNWISDAAVRIPGEGDYPIGEERDARYGRWRNAIVASDGGGSPWVVRRWLTLNLVLNRLSFPTPNVLRFHVEAANEGTLRLLWARRAYDPLAPQLGDGEYVEVARARVQRGPNLLALPIDWDAVDLVVYPATATMRDGQAVNAVHDAHVTRLGRLATLSRSTVLAEWAERWRGYGR